jgi:hypothetical protein
MNHAENGTITPGEHMITKNTFWLATIAILASTTVLTGCAQSTTASPGASKTSSPPPSTSTTPASPSTAPSTAAPRPTSTLTPVPGVDYDGGKIPTDCTKLMSEATYTKTFAKVPLNDPATVGAHPKAPASAFDPVLQKDGSSIYCVWRDPKADITYLSISVVTVNSATAYGQLQKLPASGYTCDLEAEGYRCQKLSTDKQYKVPVSDTYFTRGDIGIRIQQANFPTHDLLNEIEDHVY